MAVSGSQLTRIGAFFSGIAKKLSFSAKAVGVEPVQSSFGVTGPINTLGRSVTGAILSDGRGALGTMSTTFATSGAINTLGRSVSGTILDTGQGVTGEIKD